MGGVTLRDILSRTIHPTYSRNEFYLDFFIKRHGTRYDSILSRHFNQLSTPDGRVECLTALAKKHFGSKNEAANFLLINTGLTFDKERCRAPNGIVDMDKLITHPNKASYSSIAGFEDAVCDLFLNPMNQSESDLLKWSELSHEQ